MARARFTAPATNPLIMAIWTGSADESWRVRLLSMHQVKHAEAEPRAKIEQPGQEPGIDPAAEQLLGEGRARAEQRRRAHRHDDSGVRSQPRDHRDRRSARLPSGAATLRHGRASPSA